MTPAEIKSACMELPLDWRECISGMVVAGHIQPDLLARYVQRIGIQEDCLIQLYYEEV